MRMRFGVAVVAVVMTAATLSACGLGGETGQEQQQTPFHPVPATIEQEWIPIFNEPGSNVLLNMVHPYCDVADSACSKGPRKGDTLDVVCIDRDNPGALGVIAVEYLLRQDAVSYWSNDGDMPVGFVNIDQLAADQQEKFSQSKFAELSGANVGGTSCQNYDSLVHNAGTHRADGHVK